MKKLINKLLYWYHRKGIMQMIDMFYDKNMKPQTVDTETLNKKQKELQWTAGYTRRVHYLCVYFEIIEQCKHPLFNKRIAFRLTQKFK